MSDKNLKRLLAAAYLAASFIVLLDIFYWRK